MGRLSLQNKLLLSVCALVIGSGLVISMLETHRFSKNLHQAAVQQGEYLSQALALEATNKILINDFAALQNLLNHQLSSNPSMAYLFVMKNGQVLAHTFTEGMPVDLVGINTAKNTVNGSFRRIVNDRGEYYLDVAWPIFSGKAGILRVGLTEKPYRSKIKALWLQMTAITLGILTVAIGLSFLFIRKITHPLAALAERAEKIDEKNPILLLDGAGQDEVGRVAASINKMLNRIRDYMQRLEKSTRDLDRAHQQTQCSFDIIRKIWLQDNLKDVLRYLMLRLQEIVTCKEMTLLILNPNRENAFVFLNGRIQILPKDQVDSVLANIPQDAEISFVKTNVLDFGILAALFHSANRVAALPIIHESRFIGALLVPCPGNCQCTPQALNVMAEILNHSSGALQRAASREEDLHKIQSRLDHTASYCGMVGKDAKMEAIYKLIEDIAPSDTTVLIQGESGTGKELAARAIHHKSLRKDKPFVVINCSAYPTTLLESELFGYEKGAFTGATRRKTGRFEQAHLGTVFLDEIGEIPHSAQIKLLRVLQTQQFERVGGEQTLTVDVRILAATNKDLLQQVKNGHFREDLYYRLNVILIQLPPLKARRNDIPRQARYFMQRFAMEQGKEITDLSSEALRRLLRYDWPGNVRELENCIEHAVVLARGKRIEASDLPAVLLNSDSSCGTGSLGTIVQNEARLLKEALDATHGNKKDAARRLGISRNTLYRKMRKYRINAD